MFSRSERQQLWVLVILFAIAVVIWLAVFALYIQKTSKVVIPLTRSPHGHSEAKAGKKPGKEPRHKFDSHFAEAMDRLNHALQEHPNMEVEDIILKVNASVPSGYDAPCPLSWHDNDATLSVRSDQVGKVSVSDAVLTCAEAVEQLP